jgi:hypothetical protein
VCCSRKTTETQSPLSGIVVLGEFQGFHEATNCSVIEGWAWKPAQPAAHVSVEIYDGDVKIGTVDALMFRDDLAKASIGNGRHALRFPVPASIKDGNDHVISLRIAGAATALTNSPKHLNCPKQ